ncbi:hypothetical protein TIFTF001_031917 [Ficus carica]|uniref:Myb/SANT-like domain-containing protein n=1 Tax=Ficus carica TaxID=3494 RepID=A0AA88DZ90_FICCA|nr:hypothetical protein TIFTF001_031917 [Ficus carica]
MLRKASGETYVWDLVKEKKFLKKLDEYLQTTGGKQPTLAILNIWALEFNAEFEGVHALGTTLSQKKERMKKIYKGWKVLQTRTGLGYDPVTNRVICSDEEWKSFVQVHKECKHLRHEGLRNKELYYSVFDKYHAAAYRPIFEDDGTPTTGPRNLNNKQSGGYAGTSRSRGSSGKRKVRDEADEMTI